MGLLESVGLELFGARAGNGCVVEGGHQSRMRKG